MGMTEIVIVASRSTLELYWFYDVEDKTLIVFECCVLRGGTMLHLRNSSKNIKYDEQIHLQMLS